MEDALTSLLANNQRWATEATQRDSEFFSRLVRQQRPEYLWIGCSDARVPANDIVGLLPGELFVHRNVANVVTHSDVNCQSVLQYAVDVLKVKHVIVVGHYGCGGVQLALNGPRSGGVADFWLGHVRDVIGRHRELIARIEDPRAKLDLVVELNSLEQALNVCHSATLQAAWTRGQQVSVHAWAYDLHDGRVRTLGVSVNQPDDLKDLRDRVLARVTGEHPSISES
ncbi:carbonic anhydrase [Polycyclovorans algicola]|uniref:carbonic anhydrase n=1 Tax=Polycyclovorans algicola TaxID=616992 RepID=UPI0004A73C1F|nr:carbonic anhydrase [Polycyclovorans algicola]